MMFMCTVAQFSSSVVVERVANYSSVTARESLENLRRRQQQQQQQERRRRTNEAVLMSDDFDATYDTIDYDVIQSPVAVCHHLSISKTYAPIQHH